MIYQSEAPAPEEMLVRKHQRDTYSCEISLSSSTEKTGLTGGTRVSVTLDKRIPKKKKYIKPKAFSPFLPRNKRLLNEENYDNTETIDTTIFEKDDMSHTSPGDFTEK